MSAPPIHIDHYAVVHPAIVSFRGINKAEKNGPASNWDILLAIVQSQNESLQSLTKALLSLHQQEALDIVASFDEDYYSVMAEAKDFVTKFNEQDATAFELEVRLLARQLVGNHYLILSIAEGGEVNEDSAEYGNFIAGMAQEAIAENKPTYGRKALFSLLNN